MKKLLAVLVALVVVLACSSAYAGWVYYGPGPFAVYRPWAPVVTYYSSPVVPAPVVTEAPVVTPGVVAYPPAAVYPAPLVVGPRFYYRPVRPYVRVW
jgi:hypothetical protein